MALSDIVKRQLYFESGGYCMNPTCNNEIYPYFDGKIRVNISDLAYIIGQSENGPRGDSLLTLEERDSADNILLLCKICHKGIDDNPENYPNDLLHEWKDNHKEIIKNCFKVPLYTNRIEARKIIIRIIIQNKYIFDTYGPFSEQMKNPMADMNYIWNKKCVEIIIPNNKKIIRLLDKNVDLLKEDEIILLERFREHSIEFEFNKISGSKNPYAPTYPEDFDKILMED
ncbi:MAG: hypothetical protein QM793_08390 [Muricomes sp.]